MRRPDNEPKRAFFSVSDKTGIEDVARRLGTLGYEIDSSGGTCRYLREKGITARNVNDPEPPAITRGISHKVDAGLGCGLGIPVMLGHRVATLHPRTHGGLLALATEEHTAERKLHGVPWYDIVFVDFYPFRNGIAKPDITFEQAIELIDIGGPTLVKSGAKGDRMVVCDPADRERVLKCLEQGTPEEQDALRAELRAKAFYVVSCYYGDVARYMGGDKYFVQFGEMVATCKYGENPHQQFAALCSDGSDDPLALSRFRLESGQPLSYINWTDLDRLLETMVRIAATFEANGLGVPRIALGVKHGNICGAGVSSDAHQAIRRMVDGDPLALFGGFVMTNFTISSSMAEVIVTHRGKRVLDGVVAPAFTPGAPAEFARKADKCRLITNESLMHLGVSSIREDRRVREVRGGFLVQDSPQFLLTLNHPELVVHDGELGYRIDDGYRWDWLLAWAVASTSNSNTITIVRDGAVLGNGVAQQSRIGAAKLALMRARDAGHDVSGAVAASDSFFVSDDAPTELINAGVRNIISTSGSINDEKVIASCKEKGGMLLLIPDKVARGFFGH